MQIRKVMSRPVVTVTPADTIVRAADLMRRQTVGAMPVLDEGRLVGIVTDRDIVMRAVCDRHELRDLTVSDVMSPDPVSCRADQSVAEAAAIMGDRQVRRLLVLDEAGQLAGVLSVGDIAKDVSEELAGQALGEIVEWRESDRK